MTDMCSNQSKGLFIGSAGERSLEICLIYTCSFVLIKCILGYTNDFATIYYHPPITCKCLNDGWGLELLCS